ncbi:cytochrome P450 [Hymenobacter weizhouensis]|uniref:cytochrome P450 n=1 Tax=Hymenobacter sp. YIM 151500-1 TaxID=2987689 RepID=UPI002225FA82|nr:cytochrome P450 [Hymenobacter sp. YIM 151500-1]UYZ65138.1 cytochrome P450 [Hymenobacter sp. YIM 151500-1]
MLFPEVQDILCRAACAWCQVPLREAEVRRRAADFGAMVDAFGAVGARHSRGKQARQRAESWIRDVIRHVRRGSLRPAHNSPLAAIARHREPDGKLLSDQMAAVELINLLRPIVAIATYVTFAAVALHGHPSYRQLLQNPEEDYTELFVQEVRRHSPLAPFLGARVCEDFTWHGYRFPKGRLVLLDVYGTNHDPHLWPDPDTFWPDRFRNWQENPFDFIPQGGGGYATGHRCAGEWITIEVLKHAVTFLSSRLRYELPPQDLGYDLSRMPTLPRSGFVMRNVQLVGEPAHPLPAVPVEEASGCPFH